MSFPPNDRPPQWARTTASSADNQDSRSDGAHDDSTMFHLELEQHGSQNRPLGVNSEPTPDIGDTQSPQENTAARPASWHRSRGSSIDTLEFTQGFDLDGGIQDGESQDGESDELEPLDMSMFDCERFACHERATRASEEQAAETRRALSLPGTSESQARLAQELQPDPPRPDAQNEILPLPPGTHHSRRPRSRHASRDRLGSHAQNELLARLDGPHPSQRPPSRHASSSQTPALRVEGYEGNSPYSAGTPLPRGTYNRAQAQIHRWAMGIPEGVPGGAPGGISDGVLGGTRGDVSGGIPEGRVRVVDGEPIIDFPLERPTAPPPSRQRPSPIFSPGDTQLPAAAALSAPVSQPALNEALQNAAPDSGLVSPVPAVASPMVAPQPQHPQHGLLSVPAIDPGSVPDNRAPDMSDPVAMLTLNTALLSVGGSIAGTPAPVPARAPEDIVEGHGASTLPDYGAAYLSEPVTAHELDTTRRMISRSRTGASAPIPRRSPILGDPAVSSLDSESDSNAPSVPDSDDVAMMRTSAPSNPASRPGTNTTLPMLDTTPVPVPARTPEGIVGGYDPNLSSLDSESDSNAQTSSSSDEGLMMRRDAPFDPIEPPGTNRNASLSGDTLVTQMSATAGPVEPTYPDASADAAQARAASLANQADANDTPRTETPVVPYVYYTSARPYIYHISAPGPSDPPRFPDIGDVSSSVSLPHSSQSDRRLPPVQTNTSPGPESSRSPISAVSPTTTSRLPRPSIGDLLSDSISQALPQEPVLMPGGVGRGLADRERRVPQQSAESGMPGPFARRGLTAQEQAAIAEGRRMSQHQRAPAGSMSGTLERRGSIAQEHRGLVGGRRMSQHQRARVVEENASSSYSPSPQASGHGNAPPTRGQVNYPFLPHVSPSETPAERLDSIDLAEHRRRSEREGSSSAVPKPNEDAKKKDEREVPDFAPAA